MTNGYKFTISMNSKKVFVSEKADYTKRSVQVSNEIDKGIKGCYHSWVSSKQFMRAIIIYKKDGYKIQ
jgi:hypothetical protein